MLTTMPASAGRRAPIRPAAPALAPDPACAQAPPVDALRWECQCESCFALRIKEACRSVRRPRASRPTDAQARRSVRAARAPVVLRGPLCLLPRRGRRKRLSVGRSARQRAADVQARRSDERLAHGRRKRLRAAGEPTN